VSRPEENDSEIPSTGVDGKLTGSGCQGAFTASALPKPAARPEKPDITKPFQFTSAVKN
jgi:hypothetical protein